MTDEKEQNEVVVTFDYYGDSLNLSETEDGDYKPGAHPGEARVEVDPLVEAFARSPYDPVIGAMMMGRATGEVIAHPPEPAWMRAIAAILAIGLIGQLPIVYFARWGDDFLAVQLASPSFVLSVVLACGGLMLAVRLLRGSAG